MNKKSYNTFCVQMVTAEGKTVYAGKDSWELTNQPEFVMTLKSAQGKARWWKKISNNPNRLDTELVAMSIIPVNVTLNVCSTECELIKL